MPGGAFLAGKRLGNPCRAQTHHGPARRGRTPGNENWFPPSNSQSPSWVPWRCSADRCSIDRLKVHFPEAGEPAVGQSYKGGEISGYSATCCSAPHLPRLDSSTCCLKFCTCPPSPHANGHRAEVWLGKVQGEVGSMESHNHPCGKARQAASGMHVSAASGPLPSPPPRGLPAGDRQHHRSPSCLEGSDAAHLGRVLPTDLLGCPPPPTPVPMSCCCRVTSPAVPGRGGPAGPAGRFGFMGRELAALAGLRSVRAGPSWTVEDAEPRRGASLNLLTATWAAGQPDRLRGGPRETLPRPGEAKAAPGTCRSCCILLACIFEEYFRCRGT